MRLLALLIFLAGCVTETPQPDPTPEPTPEPTPAVESDEANRDGECGFNRDCPADQRCECDGACWCADGERGAGVNGVDTCDDGEDCTSALCVEGTGGVFYCSDECEGPQDCGPALPQCLDVAFVGRICVRE